MLKVATKPKTFGIRDSYKFLVNKVLTANPTFTTKKANDFTRGIIYKEDGSLFIDYATFKDILKLYYIKAGVRLINGYSFSLGSGLGDIYIARQGRNPEVKPRLNRGESFKLRKKLIKRR